MLRLRAIPTALQASLLALLLCPPALAGGLDEKAVGAVVRRAMQDWKVPGAAVAVVRHDKVIYLEVFGVREYGKEDPVTPDTLFAIASCTKAFTAAAIGSLVDEGKARWDDPVRKHLPYFRLADPLADRDVTLRDLLCHRTGLARHDLLWWQTNLSRKQLLRRMAHIEQARPFRSGYLYNNNMFIAAGLAAGAASRGSWDELVEDRLFKPLGMTGATCSPSAAKKSPNRASRHNKDKEGAIEVRPWTKLDTVGPAGSIHASIRDMTRWVRFQLGDGTWEGKRILKKATLDEMHTPQVVVRRAGLIKVAYPNTHQVSYGLGWFIHDHRGHFMFSHTGGLSGARARVVLVPEKKLGVIVLMNSGVGSSFASMHYVVTNSLLDLLLDLPRKDWNAYYLKEARKLEAKEEAAREKREKGRHAGTKPSRELKAYVGTYREPAYGKVRVSLKEGKLFLRWGRLAGPLEHFHFDTFVGRRARGHGPEPRVTFRLGAGGAVEALRLWGREFGRD